MTAIRYLGIIPARAGSKGLPGKNTADLGGKPVLQYTLDAATASRRIDRAVVTSDDETALALARDSGVSIVRRPRELAADASPTIDAVLHAVDCVEGEGGDTVEAVVLLQPTSPFRGATAVDEAVAAFEASQSDTLVSVVPASQHPCMCVTKVDGRVQLAVEPPAGVTRRQDLPEFFFINGAIYVARVDHLRRNRTFHDEHSAFYVMEPRLSVNIDDQFDLDVARGLLATTGGPDE